MGFGDLLLDLVATHRVCRSFCTVSRILGLLLGLLSLSGTPDFEGLTLGFTPWNQIIKKLSNMFSHDTRATTMRLISEVILKSLRTAPLLEPRF